MKFKESVTTLFYNCGNKMFCLYLIEKKNKRKYFSISSLK